MVQDDGFSWLPPDQTAKTSFFSSPLGFHQCKLSKLERSALCSPASSVVPLSFLLFSLFVPCEKGFIGVRCQSAIQILPAFTWVTCGKKTRWRWHRHLLKKMHRSTLSFTLLTSFYFKLVPYLFFWYRKDLVGKLWTCWRKAMFKKGNRNI